MRKNILIGLLSLVMLLGFFPVEQALAQPACTGTCFSVPPGCITPWTSGTGTCTGGQTCCVNIPPVPPPGGTTTITFANPLNYDDVNALLGSVLVFLQGFIVTISLIFIIVGAFMYITSSGDTGRIETAKNCITAALIGLALGIAAPSFLKEISSILGWESADLPDGVGTDLTLLEIASNVLNFLLSVVGVVAIIMLVVGGFMYLTAAGDEDRIDTGKNIVKYSIIGIIVALGSMVLVRQLATFFA